MLRKIRRNIISYSALFFVLVLMLSGIFQGIIQSLQNGGIQNYIKLFGEDGFKDSLLLSLRLSILTTFLAGILCLILFYSLYCLRESGLDKEARLVKNILLLPVLFPYIVAAFCLFIMFMQSGFLARICFSLGLIDSMSEFPVLVNDRFGIGIVLGYLWKTIPFMLLMLYPRLEEIQKRWYDLGKVYGANRFKFFVTIVFPMIKNTFATSIFIIFAYSLSAFELPYFLGQTYPQTLSVYSYLKYTKGPFEGRPEALAANFVLIAIVIIVGVIGWYFYDKEIEEDKR